MRHSRNESLWGNGTAVLSDTPGDKQPVLQPFSGKAPHRNLEITDLPQAEKTGGRAGIEHCSVGN